MSTTMRFEVSIGALCIKRAHESDGIFLGFEFESFADGKLYLLGLNQEELEKHHKVFAFDATIAVDMTSERPSGAEILVGPRPDQTTARLTYNIDIKGRKQRIIFDLPEKEYPEGSSSKVIDLERQVRMHQCVHDELREEIKELRKKIETLDRGTARLETICAALTKHSGLTVDGDAKIRIASEKKPECDRSKKYFNSDQLDTKNDAYEQAVRSGRVDVNDGIEMFLKRIFHRHPFYPTKFDWDFDESLIKRVEFMIANGLDVTLPMDDPKDTNQDFGHKTASISCIDFVKQTVIDMQDEIDHYCSDPRHEEVIVAGKIPELLERMNRCFRLLDASALNMEYKSVAYESHHTKHGLPKKRVSPCKK